MGDYQVPQRDTRFILEELAGLRDISCLPGCEEATPDLVAAIHEEAGKFAADVLAPLNSIGDRQGCCTTFPTPTHSTRRRLKRNSITSCIPMPAG